MAARWLFLAAYTCSGLAGLVYEVTWTRLLTLYMGHTTAAASTVLAAFMGGLAIGSAAGGRVASRITRRQAFYIYAALEFAAVAGALAMPFALEGARPLLAWAYRDGAPGLLFPTMRLLYSLAALALPAAALGATFPMAIRCYVGDADHPGREGGLLYAVNTVGAATGAAAAGFALIPAFGISGTTLVGVAGSVISAAIALILARNTELSDVGAELVPLDSRSGDPELSRRVSAPTGRRQAPPLRKTKRTGPAKPASPPAVPQHDFLLAAVVVAVTGLATFTYEVAWTRVFSMVIGPSTYAFASTLTAFVAGIAGGSFVGSALAGRSRGPRLPLAFALGAAAIAAAWASSFAGSALPRRVMQELAAATQGSADLLVKQSLEAAAIIVPLACALGVAFPLALELAGPALSERSESKGVRSGSTPRRLGAIYAINTVAAVAGSLLAGFVAIPIAGLQNTIRLTTVLLAAAAILVIVRGVRATPGARSPYASRIIGVLPGAAAIAVLLFSPAWDRDLLASGMYKYARNVPRDLDPESMLKAGTLLYYDDGATATVSVKRLTGELSLAVDGKIDASTSGDMLTQKLLAHLPLLFHADPSGVCIIGLGSGVTLASALVHPVESVDVVEISPEVVEASQLFAAENHHALDDPRVRLVVGDGRSHLALGTRQYDVIISEPSNPWMAGVAALFTREFFEAARSRLAPGGIICQWTHTYDISDADLRSVVATFQSVFPNGTMWLAGNGDLLLVATADAEPRLENITDSWRRPGVAADLVPVSVRDPFGVLSLFVGGRDEMTRYAAGGAIQRDDRMALEFTGPRAVNSDAADTNVAALRGLLGDRPRPPAVARVLASAGAAEWRYRAAMMLEADAYAVAYDDYARALALEPADGETHAGFVRAAAAAGRQADAERLLKRLIAERPMAASIRVALSKLQAASGSYREAVATAEDACLITPVDPAALEQLASLHADLGDVSKLQPVAAVLQERFADRPGARYYAAASRFISREFDEALRLAREAVAMDSHNAAAQNLLGAINASMGRKEAARESFEAALRLNPADASTYTNLGMLALESGDRRGAAALFIEALSLDPQSAAAREGLARARP
jgi:spermidine synthase